MFHLILIFVSLITGCAENSSELKGVVQGSDVIALHESSTLSPWIKTYAPYTVRVIHQTAAKQCTLNLVYSPKLNKVYGVTAKHCIPDQTVCNAAQLSWSSLVKHNVQISCAKMISLPSETQSHDLVIVSLTNQSELLKLFNQDQSYPPLTTVFSELNQQQKLVMVSFFNYGLDRCEQTTDLKNTSLNLSIPPKAGEKLLGFLPKDAQDVSNEKYFHYLTTCGGSSGAFLFEENTGKVVGLHTSGVGGQNSAIRSSVLKKSFQCIESGICL